MTPRIPGHLIAAPAAALLITGALAAGTPAHAAPAAQGGSMNAFGLSTAPRTMAQAVENNEPADIVSPAPPEQSSVGVVRIALDGQNATIQGGGAEATPGSLRITGAGTYILSGSYTGNIAVEAPEQSDVVLILEGAQITAPGGSAIEGRSGGTLAILYADGSVNAVRDDGGTGLAPGTPDDGAAIRSTPALTLGGGLAGSGSLEVHGAHGGVDATGSLALTGGSTNVQASGDALSSTHSVTLSAPDVRLTAGKNGIVSESEQQDRGYIDMHQGAVAVTAGGDGFSASGDVRLRGGGINVHTAQGAEAEIADGSAKAVKAGDAILVEGGAHAINSGEHGLAADQLITQSGGELSIAANKKGLRSRGEIAITGGKLDVTRSVEGAEAPNLTISGGTTHIVSYDDSLNVARDEKDGGMPPGQVEPNAALTISGGTVTLIARDDCIDSNGTLTISGGDVTLVGTEAGHGALLDSDGEFLMNGGTVSGAGRDSLSVTPSWASAQGWLSATATGPAGSHVQILDASGNVLADYITHRSFGEVFLSSAAIVPGASYQVVVNGQAVEAVAGVVPVTPLPE